MSPSTRTPEGQPNHCPMCQTDVPVEPTQPPGDATCPACGHLLWIETSPESGAVIVIHDVDRFLSTLDTWEDLPAPPSKVVLDMTDVNWLSSLAFGRLVRWKKKHQRSPTRIIGLHSDLFELFKILRLDEFFELEA